MRFHQRGASRPRAATLRPLHCWTVRLHPPGESALKGTRPAALCSKYHYHQRSKLLHTTTKCALPLGLDFVHAPFGAWNLKLTIYSIVHYSLCDLLAAQLHTHCIHSVWSTVMHTACWQAMLSPFPFQSPLLLQDMYFREQAPSVSSPLPYIPPRQASGEGLWTIPL